MPGAVQKEKLPLDVISTSIFLIGELLGRTWRFSLTGRSDLDPFHDRGKGCIYAFWHSHLLPLAFCFRNTGKTAVISESRDGMRAAAVAQRWGHAVIQGSSSRHGTFALRSCIRALRNGSTIVITPDGPRGPKEIAKTGTAQLALFSGASVVPVSALPQRAWRLGSWDGFMIPAPFTRISIHLHDPLDPRTSMAEKNPASHLTSHIQKALAS